MLDAVPGEPDSVSLAYEGRELVGLRPMVKKGQEQCKGEASPFRTFCLQNNKNQKIIKLSLFPNRLVSLTRNLIRFMIQASLPLFPPGWCLSSGGLMQDEGIVARSRRGSLGLVHHLPMLASGHAPN